MSRARKNTKGRATKLSPWRDKFMPTLRRMHRNHANSIFHRLMKKSSTLRSSLKRRSKEYEVKFSVSLEAIRKQMLAEYGNGCTYCGNTLDIRNMVCDHIKPMSMGGDSTIGNLQLICDRCNTRKGPLNHEMYKSLVSWLDKQPREMRQYINRKLAKNDVFGG